MSDNRPGRTSYAAWFGFFLILLLTPRIWLCFVPGTFNYRTFLVSYHPMLHKNCVGKMRVIAGAIEMYNMDKNEMMDSINSEADLQILIDSGYLKGDMPRCAKFYEDDHPALSLWLGWGRSVVSVPDCYEGQGLSRDGQLNCRLHGKLLAE